ncbi:MAG: DoxX family protein [Flavobacteriales bacterium]|nr:DoxX family protein [Flavobacteriales bacterium]
MYLCIITDCSLVAPFQGMWAIQALVSSFLAILFIQSGLDKVLDWKGNLEWLTGHFSRSFLSGMVPILLGTLTLFEIAAGVVSALGVVEVLVYRSYCFAFLGSLISAVSLVMLFFGQRIAKDYAGAGGLVPYFILVVIDLYFMA